MTDIDIAIKKLKESGIEGFERMGILVIPVSSPDDIYDMATRCRRIFKEIEYEKSWQIDPYYIQNKDSLREAMYG